jgi:hypothetical protein
MADVIDLTVLRQHAAARNPSCSTRAPSTLPSLIKLEEVASHRSSFCLGYDACLSEALIRGWPSWTCRCCSQFALRDELRASAIAHEGTRRGQLDTDSYARSTWARPS